MAVAGAIESLIMKLNPESDSRTKKALMALTKLTKDKENVYLFCLKGGLKRLLALIQLPNETIADMALSVLANCALEEKSRREVSVRRIKIMFLTYFLLTLSLFVRFLDKEIGWDSCSW